MNVALVGPAASYHTRKWASVLVGGEDRVTVFDTKGDPRPVPGCRVVPTALEPLPRGAVARWIHTGKVARELRATLLRERFDAVNVQWLHGTLFTRAFHGVPGLVVTPWGSDVLLSRGWLRRRMQSDLLGRARLVICASRHLADATRALAGVDLPVEVVPFGVDVARFHPAASPPVGDPVVLGAAKALQPIYGLDVLLEALARLPEGLPAWRLVIAGDGPERPRLERQARDLGLVERVTFRGAVPADAMPDFYRELDVFVMPSRGESFGVSAVEASASGLPVIATDVGGVPEVVIRDRTGLLIPREDPAALAAALASLLRHPDLRRTLGAAGRLRVEEVFDLVGRNGPRYRELLLRAAAG